MTWPPTTAEPYRGTLERVLARGRDEHGSTTEGGRAPLGVGRVDLTHVGQLAFLRRLAGAPIAPEKFICADVDPERFGPEQAPPAKLDGDWPERPE